METLVSAVSTAPELDSRWVNGINLDEYFNSGDFCKYYTVQEYKSICSNVVGELSLLNLNIRSFHANSSKLEAFLSTTNYFHDLFVLSETWNTNESLGLTNIAGYNGFRTCRIGNGRGGGVSVYTVMRNILLQ